MDLILLIAKVLVLACHIVITIKAFQDEILEGLLVLLIPFYLLYYGFRRLNMAGKDLFLWIYIFAVATVAFGGMFPMGFGPNVAKMVSTEIADSLLGEPAGEPACESKDTVIGNAVVCEFRPKSGARKRLSVTLVKKCSGLSDKIRSGLVISSMKDVADEAYSLRDNSVVRKGETCVLIATPGVADSINTQISRQDLARSILRSFK